MYSWYRWSHRSALCLWQGLFWLQSQGPSPWMTFSSSLIPTGRHRIFGLYTVPSCVWLGGRGSTTPTFSAGNPAPVLAWKQNFGQLPLFLSCKNAIFSEKPQSRWGVMATHSTDKQVCPGPWYPIPWHEADVPSVTAAGVTGRVLAAAWENQAPWGHELQPTVPPTTPEEGGTHLCKGQTRATKVCMSTVCGQLSVP